MVPTTMRPIHCLAAFTELLLTADQPMGMGPPARCMPVPRTQRIRCLPTYQRDLEEWVADITDEIRRVREGGLSRLGTFASELYAIRLAD